MTDMSASILLELQRLNQSVQKSGSFAAGSDMQNSGGSTAAMSKEDKLRSKEENNLAEKIRSSMKKSSNSFVRAAAKNASSLNKIRELQQGHSKEKIKEFIELRKQARAHNITSKDYLSKLKQLGFTVDDTRRTDEELNESFEELNKTVGNLDDKMEGTRRTSGKLKAMFAAMIAVGKEVMDVQLASMRTGVEENLKQTYTARLMGMSQVELLETMGQYRQTIESSEMSTDQFMKRMNGVNDTMFDLTGSLKAGPILAAEAMQNLRQLGASMSPDKFIDSQTATFEKLHNSLSMTADQFNDLNKEMLSSQSVRMQLFKLDKSKRVTYFQDLQQTAAKLRMDGLSIDQTKKMIETMEGIGGQSAKDRMKQAAKMQALLGSVGMSEQGAEAANLMRGGLRSEDDKARFADLMKQASGQISNEYSDRGFAGEMAMDQLLDTTGLRSLFEQGFSDLELNQDLAINADEKTGRTQNTAEINPMVSGILKHTQQIAGVLSEGNMAAIIGSLGALAFFGKGGMFRGALASMSSLVTKISGPITSILSKSKGLITKGISTGRTALMRGGAAVAGSTTAAVATAGAVGYATGTAIDKAWEKFAPESHRSMQDVVGGTLSEVLDTSFKQTMDSTMDFWGGQISSLLGMNDKDQAKQEQEAKRRDQAAAKAEQAADKQNNILERIAETTEKGNKLTKEQTNLVERKTDKQIQQADIMSDLMSTSTRFLEIARPNRALT